MKKFAKGKNDISSRKFLEKFLTKRKKNIDKNENESSSIENSSKTPIKTNVSDYNSIDWLMKFSQKKKNKFFEKNKEDINRIKTSRNSLKKFSNYKYNLLNNNYLKNSTKNLKYNFGQSYQGGKKSISLEKKNITQMKFIKQLKEELKQNPEKFNDNNKSINKKTEKIKNIKIKKLKSNESKRKIYSSSFNIILKEKKNKNKDNESLTIKNKMKTESNENDESIRLYNKFKSKSGDLEKENYPKRINSQKQSQKKTNIIKTIKNQNEQSKPNLKLNNNLKSNKEINKKKNKKNKNLEININDDIKTFSYHNMKIKISQNPKIKQNKNNKKNKNNLVLSNTEMINSITTIKLKTKVKNKNSFLKENKPLSLSEDPSRTITGNSLRNKYRDLIYEYQSEIDS